MLCITGAEKTLAELRDRVARHPTAQLQEIRLDLLQEPWGSDTSLPVDPGCLLLACRPVREGGQFQAGEEQRLARLEAFLPKRPGWIDIELSTQPTLRERVCRAARRVGTKVLISQHVFKPDFAMQAGNLLDQLAASGGDAVKLAVQVQDAAELLPLWHAGRQAKSTSVLVGMGPAGLLSRALYPRFGSAWTYVASQQGKETADGQLTHAQCAQFRLPPSPDTSLYVLLGGPQVLHSPGPAVYNRLFATNNMQALYLSVVTQQPNGILALLRHLGFGGASVTMPLKQQMLGCMDTLGEEARAAGAVNTITLEQGARLRGDLTDGLGAVAVLERASGPVAGKRVVILGNGGTAAAIAQSLKTARAQVTLLGRNLQRVRQLADLLAVEADHLDQLPRTDFQLLVQATPVGSSDPQASLVADRKLLAGKTVLDVILGVETRLLRDTRAAGGVPVSGRTLWAEQGRLQLARWFDLQIPAKLLETDP